MKKQHEERLDEVEARLSGLDAADAERDKLKARVSKRHKTRFSE